MENLVLRHQLAVCARSRRPALRDTDRRFWSTLARAHVWEPGRGPGYVSRER